MVQGLQGPQKLRLRNVAYCTDFQCNLVSFDQLRQRGYYWDTQKDLLYRSDDSVLCKLNVIQRQRVLEYIPLDRTNHSAYMASKRSASERLRQQKRRTTKDPRPDLVGDSRLWHLRMGHIGPRALHHLGRTTIGTRLKGPCTTECEHCAVAKITRQISRRPPDRLINKPCQELHIDWTDLQIDYKGFVRVMFITCAWTGMVFPYFMTTHGTERENLRVLKDFVRLMQSKYNLKVSTIRSDNELNRGITKLWFQEQCITFEPSAPDTHDQNGLAERSGGVIMAKSRAMRIGAKLPHDLWVESTNAAVYLHNRSPRYSNGWETPYELFYSYIAEQNGFRDMPRKPQLSHLRAYGCRAYAMTKDAQTKKNRLMKLDPRAHIGYLVGYDSTNIFRIWIPHQGKVISTRDVIFDEKTFFNGRKEYRTEPLIQKLDQLVQEIQLPDTLVSNEIILDEDEDEVLDTIIVDTGEDGDSDQLNDLRTALHDEICNQEGEAEWLTPPPTDPADHFAGVTIQLPVKGKSTTTYQDDLIDPYNTRFDDFKPQKIIRTWEGAFNAGRRTRLHHKRLPKPPKTHRDLATHPLRNDFIEAQKAHLREHERMRSFQEVSKSCAKGQQILSCMWVFIYKLDKHGYLIKCKARLVVCGNQQAIGDLPTRATTLASAAFRTMMAITARFDLETRQLDAVNAFVNCDLDEVVYMRTPPGFEKPGTVIRLRKALYGLRRSPLIWQKKLTELFRAIGFKELPQEPCIALNQGVIAFYYVDDIVFCYRQKDTDRVNQMITELKNQLELTDSGELKWFLGIHIVRDRVKRLLWLSQSLYIEKITNQYGVDITSKAPDTPMTEGDIPPSPSTEQASPKSIELYQKKLGSALFAAITTRPDIAFAVSKLARYSTNPNQCHHDAIDRVVRYLFETRNRSITYGTKNVAQSFICASDASFADDSTDRKSSQGYIMMLFGGPVSWKASKQDTVTTSSTEAELLALSQTAKEALFMSRLFKALTLELDESLIIDCDNRQTIRLICEEAAKLQTKLRHVDIHNHWLRQEHREGRINIRWQDTAHMIADGLTKALGRQKHQRFLAQIGLQDIRTRLDQLRRMEDLKDQIKEARQGQELILKTGGRELRRN
jgi:hypothetical protein